MSKKEYLLTIVEPTRGGDAPLALAHDTVERGGNASVVMLISDQVRRNIADFGRSENLPPGDAEAFALDRLTTQIRARVGGDPLVTTRHRWTDIAGLVTDDITAIAVPERMISRRAAQRLSERTGVPVVVTPTDDNKAA